MCEGSDFNIDADDSAEAFVPSVKIDGGFRGQDFALSAQNTHLRVFSGEDAIYNRALVDVGDGSLAALPLDPDLIDFMIECGFRAIKPERPDETDTEYLSAGFDSLLYGDTGPAGPAL